MKYLILDKRQRVQTEGDLSYALMRFQEELIKMGVDYTIAYNDEIEITFINNQTKIYVQGTDITDYTHIYLRGVSLDRQFEYETRVLIADYIEQYNSINPTDMIKIQNAASIRGTYYYDKIWITYICTQNQIKVTDTHYRVDGLYSVKPSPFNFPLIIKHYAGKNDLREIEGKKTIKKNVYLINSQDDYTQEHLKEKDTSEYITQEYITTGIDYRVFVSKGKAISGFSRSATKNFLTVSSGHYEKIDLNTRKDLREFAEKVAEVFKADFIAVDMMEKDGEPILQEISFHPGFKAFETKTTGEYVNMAKVILDSI